jgi:hypothetical protein
MRHLIDRLELTFSSRAARFAATNEWDEQGYISPYSWIKNHCRVSGGTAVSAVCVGQTTSGLPLSIDALNDGRIGFAHLALLAQTAEAIRWSSTGGSFDEAPLLRRAEKHPIHRFRHDCEHARHAADAQAFLDEHVVAVELRRLELLPCGGGGLLVRGVLDAEGGATLRTALDNLVLLCRRHHWKAHEGGWQLVRCGDGSILAIPPLPDWLPPARAPDPATTAA